MRHEQRLPSRPTTKFLPFRRRPVSPHSQATPSLRFRRVVNTLPKRSTEDSDSLRALRRPNSLAPLSLQLGNDTGTGDMPASSSPTPILLAANHACGGGHGLGRVKQKHLPYSTYKYANTHYPNFVPSAEGPRARTQPHVKDNMILPILVLWMFDYSTRCPGRCGGGISRLTFP